MEETVETHLLPLLHRLHAKGIKLDVLQRGYWERYWAILKLMVWSTLGVCEHS
jgi:hypothetical protein